MKKKVSRWKVFRRKFSSSLIYFLLRDPWKFVSFLTILVFFYLLPGNNYYETLQLEYHPPLVRASELDSFQPAPYPERTGLEPAPSLTAQSVIITDLDSFVPMYELNPQEKLRPASITKLMTALVALNYYDVNQVLTVRRLAPKDKNEPESEMGLAIGDRVNVKNLLYGLLVPSGNDAAYTLADNYPGGIENFMYAMNQKTKQLHMKDTHYDNPVGIDSPGQITTAHDLSLLTAVALNNNLISEIVATSRISLEDTAGKKTYVVKNVNQLLGTEYGVNGVKTGFTDDAGQCLITSVSRNGRHVVIVLLKSQDRFDESAKLIEWVFRNYQWLDLTK